MQVRSATTEDVPACIAIIQPYRARLAGYEPFFWNPAANAAAMSTMWFAHLFTTADVAIVAEEDGAVVGFLIATHVPSPPIFDIPGKTALIDDFMIADQARWDEIGGALLAEARRVLAEKGYAQIVVVNAAKDPDKTAFLEKADLSLASQWWTAAV